MTQQEIQERNKQIALLLNIKIEQCYPENKDYKQHGIVYTLEKEFAENVNSIFLGVSELKFHRDWNWLMEAVEFISSKGHNVTTTGNEVYIDDNKLSIRNIVEGGTINSSNQKYFATIISITEEASTKKEAVFIAVSDFAQKFNN